MQLKITIVSSLWSVDHPVFVDAHSHELGLQCETSSQLPKGHHFDLPRYNYDPSRKSFVLRCLYDFK